MFIGACGLVVEYVLANLMKLRFPKTLVSKCNKDVTRVQFPASAYHIIRLKEARITKPEENLVFAETAKRKVYKCDFHVLSIQCYNKKMIAKNPVNLFEYSPTIDSLRIFGGNVENIEGSLILENFTFDVDTSGRIIGLEIDNASGLLNMAPEFINENIKEAFLNVTTSNNALFLGFAVILQ